MNDPRWGRGEGDDEKNRPQENRPRGNGGKDGPPDLDELWRDFNRRLNNLFGRKRNGGGNGGGGLGPSEGGHGGRIGAGIIAGVLIAVYIGSGVYIVQEGQAGVVQQFGRYKYTTPAGIQWRLPYPFQSNEIVNMSQVRSVEIGRNNVIRATSLKDSSMLTSDENIIDVRFAVQYRINDPADFLFNNADAEGNVKLAAETAVREIVGKNKMDYVLYEGREQVAQQLAASIQRILDQYKTGIMVSSVTMQNVQPPEQVQAAFDDAVKAGQDRERAKNEAQAYANDVIPRARGAASRVIEEANGYRSRVVAQADGDAQRFTQVLAAYSKAPAVTRERMYLDTMQQIYSTTPKVLADTKNGSNVMYLPLDKLVEQASQRPAANAASASSTQAAGATGDGAPETPAAAGGTVAGGSSAAADLPPAGDDPLRSRDGFRTRSRQDDVQ
jgi:membrane protease subunit HflK